MYQSFDPAADGALGPGRLAALRARLAAAGLDGFLVPRADAHQGENVARCEERLAFLTGFTGSAGLCAVLADAAALFVDGRYIAQAPAQVSGAIEVVAVAETALTDWLGARLADRPGARIGFDPWLHNPAEIERWGEALRRAGAELVEAADNPVDAIWTDRPPPPSAAMRAHPEALAGRSSAEKRALVAAALAGDGLHAAVLSRPESVAWLLNVRGGDLARTPVTLAYAIVHDDGRVALIVDPDKVDGAVRAHLGNEVAIAPPADLGPLLDALAGRRVALERGSIPVWIAGRLARAGAETVWTRDPTALPKAQKTAAELAGARAAHRRDGAAMVRFLAWLDRAAPAGGLTEIAAAEKLESFRAGAAELRDIAFDTISAAGPNAALPHYRVTRASDRAIEPGTLYLVDSGGQYPDGTTDVTRTIAIGAPAAEHRRLFTLVLKGMIAISRARFPVGVAGRDIDALARAALWRAGFDFDHGVGHGVGSYLGVHEGPQAISRRAGDVALAPGMIVSNEPGYYRIGGFGIRIENLVAVTEPAVPQGGERPMLGFETLTLAPIDRRLIDPALLDPAEAAWIDAYHARVARELDPALDRGAEAETRAWLAAACAPLSAGSPTPNPAEETAMNAAATPETTPPVITITPIQRVVVVRAGGAIIGETSAALSLAEGSREPVIYVPRADIAMAFLEPGTRRTTCPWKGEAVHFDIVTKSVRIDNAAWSYETPKPGVAAIAGHLAFYADKATVEPI